MQRNGSILSGVIFGNVISREMIYEFLGVNQQKISVNSSAQIVRILEVFCKLTYSSTISIFSRAG
jgi:hypothetical protein